MNLDNIMFIIIFLLLIVILGVLYYMSNNIKKNQNKINILESDVNALRERMGMQGEKMNSIDAYLNKNMIEKKSGSKEMNSDPVDFSNFLEKISAMNDGLMGNDDEDNSIYSTSEDEESNEKSSSSEEKSSIDDDSDDDSHDNSQEDSQDDSEEDDSQDDNSQDDDSQDNDSEDDLQEDDLQDKDSVEEKGSEQEETSDSESSVSEIEEVKSSKKVNIKEEVKPIVNLILKKEEVELVTSKKEEVEPVTSKKEEVVKKEKIEPVNLVKELGLDDLMDDKSGKKMPSESIKKLDLGTVVLGGDRKTKYIVSLNKLGKKYWKKY